MGKETEYTAYDDMELYKLMDNPLELADKPYLLHAAYALSCLSEAVSDDDDECDPKNIWGKRIPERILSSVVRNAAENFNDAAQNRLRIDVWGRPCSVRKQNKYNPDRLLDIFNFRLDDGEYIIEKSGVMKLGASKQADYQSNKDLLSKNKNFLRKVIMLAEDDENDGWEKLTDMEVSVYCWALFIHKLQSDSLQNRRNNVMSVFMEEYKKHLYVTMEDLMSCVCDSQDGRVRPQMYLFDCEKVLNWNEKKKQKSVVCDISDEDAENYWYDTALKTTFKRV